MRGTGTIRRILAPALLVVLVGSACGTRLDRAQVESAQQIRLQRGLPGESTTPEAARKDDSDATAAGPSGATTTVTAGSLAAPARAGGAAKSPARGGAPGRAGAGTSTADGATTVPERTAAGSNAPGKRSQPGGAPATAGQEATAPASGRSAAAVPKGAPITIGVVGTLSGPVGAAYAAGPPTLLAWRRLVNERGGLGGHPVDIIFGDDGGDPARHRSLLQEFVENKKVVAFVGNPAPLTGSAGRAYLEQKRVPVIGGDLASAAWHESPVFFPQGTTLPEMLVATIATGAKFTTKKKLGIATCAEAQACRDAYERWPEVARRFGLDLVYRAQVSLAQPDFTAECLGARNAGVELFATVVDATGVSRFSTSCARQGFKPTYLFIQTVVDDREKGDPNLQGAYGAVATFPYPADDSPATAEYHSTMQRFAPDVTPAASSTQLWVAAKIFERAATGVAGPLERATLLDTLFTFKNETFGGLTQPITYNRDAAASPVPCWFVQTISNGAWVAPQGSRPVCP